MFFIAAIFRYHIPPKLSRVNNGHISFSGYELLLERRFGEAIDRFLLELDEAEVNDGIASALSQAYQQLAFQTLANQVRKERADGARQSVDVSDWAHE